MKIIKAICWICGREFRVVINKGKIVTKCFHSYLHVTRFPGWDYRITSFEPKLVLIPEFKNKFYKIMGYTNLQRSIVYTIWSWFNNKRIPYWECPSCLKESNKNVKNRSKLHSK